jgi:hypothetical protein
MDSTTQPGLLPPILIGLSVLANKNRRDGIAFIFWENARAKSTTAARFSTARLL